MSPPAASAPPTQNFIGVCAVFLSLLGFACFASSAHAQDLIAGWDFQTTTNGGTAVAAAPATPKLYIANFGSGTLYLDGSNGSSNWSQTGPVELDAFGGATVNTAGTSLSTVTTSPAALALVGSTANGKVAVFRFSMSGYKSLTVSLAAQRTGTGFTQQLWEFSSDGGVTWSALGTLVSGATAGTIASAFNTSGVLSLPATAALDNVVNALVRVTFSGGTGGNNRVDNIQLRATPDVPNAPSIDSFAPTSGFVGDTVTISGTNFTGVTSVKFNSVEAATFSFVNAQTVTAVVPSGATTGPITLTTPVATAASSGGFTVIPTPVPLTTAVYTQNFSTWGNSSPTLPLGWSATGASASFQNPAVDTNGVNQVDWNSGFLSGFRGNASVFGFQNTGGSGTTQQILTFRNDTGATITELNVSYTGRAAVLTNTRLPSYSVTVGGQSVVALAYSTADGDSIPRSALVSGLSIAPSQIFQIIWTTQPSSTGTGSNRQIGISDVSVSAVNTAPSISVMPPSITNLTATQGNFGPSTNFVVNASNLSNNITVTATDSNNFAISTDNSLFTNTLLLPTNSSGAVTNASVFVRLTGAAPDGAKSNTVTLASDATVTNVIVTGTVSPPPVPALTATPTNVGPLQSLQGSPSLAPYGSYALSGTAVTNSVTISAPAGLQLSYTNDGSGFGSSLTIPAAPPGGTFSTNVYVRIGAGVSVGTFTNFITNSTLGGVSNTLVQVTGNVDPLGTPQLSPANEAVVLTNFATERGTPSASESFPLSGQNLAANVTVTPPAGWQVSTNPGSTFFTNAPITVVTNAPSGGLTNATIYVRLAGTTTTNYTTNNTRLSLVSGAISNNVLLAGSVTNPAPSLVLSTNTLTNFVTPTNTPSAWTNFTVIGTNLNSNVTVTPPTGWQVSATNTNNPSSSAITIGTNNDATVNASVFLRIGSVAVPTTFSNSVVAVQSGTTSTNLVAVGSVTSAITLPTIANFSPTNGPRGTLVTINGTGFGSVSSNGVAFGGISTTKFTVVGSNQITAFVPLSAPTGRITVSNPVGVATSSINFTIDALTLRVPPVIGGGVVTPARLSVPAPVPADTLVTLQSSVVPTATVPATVTIPAGQSFVVFPITTTTVGANVNVSISAFSANYLGATAPTTVSSTFTRAASFMEEGYEQDFATFTNNRTLPFGWVTTVADGPFTTQVTNTAYLAWGTTNEGPKFSTETTKVLGYQHAQTAVFAPTKVARHILTLRNDTGTNVPQIRITYTGRTTNAFADVDRFPAYTVTVAAAVNTNVVNFTTNVSDLNYSTGAGDNVVVTAKLALTNAAVANGIPASTNFTVTWASTSGDGFDNSAQIGLGDLTVELVRPYVQLTPVAGVNDFITTAGTASVPRLFYASGQDLQGPLVVTAPDNFEVSLSEAGPYAASNSLTPVAGTVAPTFVYARIKASAPQAPATPPATVAGTLSAASTGATSATQPISGVVFAAGSATQVLASPDALTNFTAIRPDASSFQAFFASGVNLSNNITVSATTGFQVSTNTNNSSFATGVTIPRDAFNRVVPTPVYTRLAPNQSVGAKTGTATVASGGTNDTVVLGGTVTAPSPFITLTGTFTPFSTTRGTASAAQTCTVSATDLVAPLVLTAPEGYEISSGGAYADTVSLAPTDGNLATTTLSVRIADYAPAANPLAGNLTASSSGAVPRSLALTGTVTANGNAWISARPSSLTGFLTLSNIPSDAQTFTVQAANITQDLRVSVTDKYEVSTNGVNFASSLLLERATNGSGGGGGGTAVVASDVGANYTGNPTNGANGGFGFSPWAITIGTTNSGSAGIFVGNPTNAGIGGMATTSFGLFANPADNGNFVNAARSFSAPLGVGESFSFQWGNNYDAGAGNKGVNITNAGGSNVFNMNMGGSAAITLAQGTNAAVEVQPASAYGTNVMTFSFTRTASNTFRVSAPAGRSLGPGFTNTFTVTNEAAGFNFYASGLQAGTPVDRDSAQPYFNNLEVTAPTSGDPGDVALTTLFVRLKAQPGSSGAADGTITASAAPAASRTIALSGRVPPPPAITASPTNLAGFLTSAGTASPVLNFTVNAQTLGGALNVSAPTGFEVSLVPTNGFGPMLSLTPMNESVPTTTVFVRFAAAAAAGDYTNSLVGLSANGLLGQTATNTVQLSGTVFASNSTPQLALPVPAALSGFSTTAGTPSVSQSYVISGTNLTAPVIAVAPANYEISTNNVNFAPIVTNAVSGTGLVSFTNYVRIAAPATVGSPAGNVTNSSVGVAAPRTVALNGTVAATPALNVDPNLLSGFQSVADFASPSQSFRLGGSNMTGGPVTISASSPYQVSLNNTDWATQTNFTPGATFNNTNVFVRLGTNSVPTNSVNGTVTLSGQGITNVGTSITVPTVALSGSTLLRPLITLSTNNLGPFESVSGFQPSASRSFTVSGTNLLTNITVAPPSQYEISTNNGTSWTTNPVTLVRTLLPQNNAIALPLLGSDFANNYVAGWTNGANGGTGFGPWQIAVNNNPPNWFAGNFVGNPAFAGITGMSSASFGFFANPPASVASVSATRSLAAALQTNQSLSFQWAVNFDTGSTNYKGFRLFSGATRLLEVGQNGFPGDLRLVAGSVTNTNLGIAYGTNPMTWTFAMSNATTLRVTSTPRDGTTNVAFSTNLTVASVPDSFVWFADAMTNTQTDQRQPYFNNLQVSGSAGFVNETAFLVRLKSNAVSGSANQAINVTSPIYAEPKQVTLNGQVFGQTLTVSTNALTGFATTRGVASQAQQFTVSGSNLVTNVTVAAPANYEISSAGASTGFASSLTLPVPSGSFGGNITNVPLWVRISAQATNTTASGTVNLTSALASASVTVNGAITNPQQPALNENYINFIYQRLLYRNPTTIERDDYLALLGGAGNIGNTTNKTKMITELMDFDPSRSLFNWVIQPAIIVDGSAVPAPNYVISSLAFAPFARLGLTPTAQAIQDFIATSRTPTAQANIPLSDYTSIGLYDSAPPFTVAAGYPAGAPYGTTVAISQAFEDLIASAPFQNAWLAAAASNPRYSPDEPRQAGFLRWLNGSNSVTPNSGWFWGNTAAGANAFGTEVQLDMLNGRPPNPPMVPPRGSVAAFRSLYQWVGMSTKAVSSPNTSLTGWFATEFNFQLRANFAALDFQLWRNWGYSASSTAYSADNVRNLLLRFPQITSGNLPTFAADQAFPGYEITASNAATPEAGLPEGLYYSAQNLPTGLAVNPSTGAIFQTGAVPSGTYNNIIVQAQNFVGIGQKTVSLTVQPPTLGPATGWMIDEGLSGANFAAVANQDNDADGLLNTHEYAFGLDPRVADAGAFTTQINGGSLIMEWKALKSGATYRVQQSGNLSTWQDLVSPVPQAAGDVDARYGRWRITIPIGGESNFYRIEATFEPGALD